MILVVGMARSGIAAARLLASQGKSVFVTDSGTPPSTAGLAAAGIPFETGGHTESRFMTAEEIVVSPGVPLDSAPLVAARRRGIPVISELELAFRYLRGEIVAVTGSNGKTTTTTLIGEVFKAAGFTVQVGGNIGVAMTSLVATSAPSTINVIEVSSFQLDAIRTFRPKVGVLLNVTPDHLDRYASFAAYRLSKFRMFENQEAADVAVLNADDANVVPPPAGVRSSIVTFSRRSGEGPGARLSAGEIVWNGHRVLPVTDICLRGSHNIENVLAAVCVAGVYAIDPVEIRRAVAGFKGVEHRLEFVAAINGIEFFNDSKATNVDSSIKAVEALTGNIILILGGKDKGGSYEPLAEAMRGRVKHVLLIGAAAGKIEAALAGRFAADRVVSMEDAVRRALDLGRPGDVVLLAPACASFDMFDNYEHRGRVFKEAVRSLT